PLVYINWFRPFQTPDPVTGLPPTSHSTQAHKCNASIISAGNIVYSCHLIPKFGQE
ncbi:hypothetical protein BD413DRAFT_440868, partial [Trametes elegans]